jgi:ArsR family transcriptional regulator, cadmium/lead-responsive transcriptional repressor
MRHELVAKLFRGFGDASRLRVLEALRDGPLHVGGVVRRTGLSQPNVSMHLACLVECGLAMRERQGRFVEYRLADKRAARLLDQAEELVGEVGRLVEACPRYRTPAARHGARSPTSRRARTRR